MPSPVVFSPPPPPSPPPAACQLSAYALALQCLQSLEIHFKCCICFQTLEETHLDEGGVCVHRYCSKCANGGGSSSSELSNSYSQHQQHEYSPGAAYPTATNGSIHNPKKDPNFDHVIRKTMEAIKYLLEYDASMKELQRVCSSPNTVRGDDPPCSPSLVVGADRSSDRDGGGGSDEERESDEYESDEDDVNIGITDTFISSSGVDIGTGAGAGWQKQQRETISSPNVTLQNSLKREYSSLTMAPEEDHEPAVVLGGKNMNQIYFTYPCSTGPQEEERASKMPRIQDSATDILQRSQVVKGIDVKCGASTTSSSPPAIDAGTATTTNTTVVADTKKAIKSFQERIHELEDFKKRHGHLNVPTSHPSLGTWCCQMRLQYIECIKHGKGNEQTGDDVLTPERIEVLSKIGFEWFKDDSFEDLMEVLKKFRESEGHCNVPLDHPILGLCLSNLKKNYKLFMKCKDQGTGIELNWERITRLENIGVKWFAVKKTFDQRLKELMEFKSNHGSLKVPYNHPTLGIWCHNMRQCHKRLMEGKMQQCGMRLTPERMAILGSMGFFD